MSLSAQLAEAAGVTEHFAESDGLADDWMPPLLNFYASGLTITAATVAAGVPHRTERRRRAEDKVYAAAFKEAEGIRRETLASEAQEVLLRRLREEKSDMDVTVERDADGEVVRTIEKRPNANSLLLTHLKAMLPESYSDAGIREAVRQIVKSDEFADQVSKIVVKIADRTVKEKAAG